MPLNAPPYCNEDIPYWKLIARDFPIVLLINVVMAIACAVFLPGWANFWHGLAVSNLIGFSIYGAVSVQRYLFTRWKLPRTWFHPLMALACIPIGFFCGDMLAALLLRDHHSIFFSNTHSLVTGVVMSLLGGALGGLYFTGKWRLAEERRQTEAARRTAVEAQLRILQTQVEPHFLFNTLANLDALIAIDPKQARVLLGHLNRYLRNSLNHSRRENSTLGDEFEQLRAYLAIMEIRLPNRFSAQIDCAAGCDELPLTPMLLHPLVENAIKHGIEPAAQGGKISVSAQMDASWLELIVSDTGIGLDRAPKSETSNGTGLANIRERLHALYGEEARLDVAALQPCGTEARIRIPLSALTKAPS